MFLERKPFTHEARRCDLSIIVGTEPFGDPLSQSVMSRKDSKGHAGGSEGPRVGVTGGVSGGRCYALGILHISILIRSAVNTSNRLAQTSKVQCST